MTFITPYWTSPRLASNLWQEMDRLLEDGQSPSSPEVVEAEDHFLLSVDMPGLKKENIQIELREHTLMVSGERKRAPQTTFKRSFTLPNTVNAEKIEARYEDGVLELYLPKIAAAQPRKIEIQSDKGSFFDKLLSSKKSAQEMKNVM